MLKNVDNKEKINKVINHIEKDKYLWLCITMRK